MSVVECVGVNLHEEGQGVEGKENLRRPGPAPHERPTADVSLLCFDHMHCPELQLT